MNPNREESRWHSSCKIYVGIGVPALATRRGIMVSLGGRRWWWTGGLAIAAAGFVAGAVLWQASGALKLSKQELRAERELGFTLRPFSPKQNLDYETVRSPEVFAQVAHFQDSLYVAGPAGLLQYDLRGNLVREFSAGRDLPGSPLVAAAVGQVAGATQSELILATADQGILLFDGLNFRQLYPADADVRTASTILPFTSGHLLIGTKKRGVLVYNGKTIQELHPTLGHLYVQAL